MLNPLEKYFEDNPDTTTFDLARDAELPYWVVANIRNGRKPIPSVREALKIAKATENKVPVNAWEEDTNSVSGE